MKILKLLLMFLCTSDQCVDQGYYTFPGLIHEVFRNNASRKDIEEFKSDLNYTEIPDSYNIIDVFNAPNSSGGHYGLRIRGWFVAPVNGNHTFYSSCSDICELYISNNIRPNNKVLIINQTKQSINQSYYHHSSGLIYLSAGNKYYIEALMANFDLNDYLSIAVITSPTSNPVLQPISMNMLSGIRIEKCNQSDVNAKYETCIFESSNFGICTCSNGQKVTKNQVVCQDGNEVVEEFVFKNFEIPLLQNTIVAVMKTLYREFTISFEVYPISYSDYWASAKSVVGLRAGADKSPAIFLQSSKSGACVAQSINNVITNFNCNKSFPLKQWSSIKISQKLVNLDYLHYIYINESIVYSAVNIKPVVLSNVKVYAAEPWSFAQNGFIRNLSINYSPITQFFHVSPGLLREVYCNISIYNFNIGALNNNPKYPLTPDSYGIIDVFDAPQNIADFYGQRIRGWFVAPQSGNYTFYSSCDNYCEFYISNDSDPKNKRLIIYQKDYTNYKEFNKYPSQNSSNIFLIKNIKYYIEALMTEGNGGDHLSIGVQIQGLPNLTLIIPNSFLSPIRIGKVY